MRTQQILVVDDDPKVALSLTKTLEHWNATYRVRTAHSGEEALAMLNTQPIDLLITDLRLPGINGLELIRRLRASDSPADVILITAFGNDRVQAEARRLTVHRCLDKPFLIEDLLQTVQEALTNGLVERPGPAGDQKKPEA